MKKATDQEIIEVAKLYRHVCIGETKKWEKLFQETFHNYWIHKMAPANKEYSIIHVKLLDDDHVYIADIEADTVIQVDT
jgi:hypothetical protein